MIRSALFLLFVLFLSLVVPTAGAQVYILNVGEEGVSRQDFGAADSLEAARIAWVNDSLRHAADSVARAEVARRQWLLDSLALEQRRHDASALRRSSLLRLWQQNHAMQVSAPGFVPDSSLCEVPDSSRVDSLIALVDSIPYDRMLTWGQPSYRIPLLPEFYIPQEPARSEDVSVGRASRWQRQLDNVEEHLRQTFGYYRHDISRIRILRRDIDIPTERSFLSTEASLIGIRLNDYKEQAISVQTLDRSLAYTDKWHRRGTSSIQMSQTALSDNWYKGGDNNMSIASDNKLVISRYDKDKKTTFETTLRLQLSGYYTTADTIHQMRVSDNTFRIDINYGYKAWKNWYYSTTTYAKTPVFDYYNTNSRVVKSTFLSPLEWNVSVGMDYKKSWNKNKSSYSLLLAPLSYNLTYVHDGRVNETSYGVEQGKCSENQFGSSITSKLEWRISKDVSLSSRLYYFTDYSSIQAECENTFNFAMSRYFSARLYLYPRFDDKRDEKIQMKEMFTFGFSAIW